MASRVISNTGPILHLNEINLIKALDAFQEAITSALQKGDPVILVNLFSLMLVHRAGRVGRNPSTGEKITIGPAKVVKFKAGKALKEAIKQDASA